MLVNKIISASVLIVVLSITACSTFIPDEDIDRITLRYQSGEYILLNDLSRNDVTIAKGTAVKLIVVAGGDWIKIYAYDKKEELLKSTRLLLLYMFEDDFPDEKFSHEALDKELEKVVRLNTSPAGNTREQGIKQGGSR